MAGDGPDALRAPTVPARVNLLLEAHRERDQPAPSSVAVAERIAAQTSVTVPAALLDRVRGGDATGISAGQLAALAQAYGCPGEYFTDPERAEDIASQFDLLRALRDTDAEIGCAGRGGDLTATSAGRDSLRDMLRIIAEHERNRPDAGDQTGVPVPGGNEPVRDTRARETVAGASPKRRFWHRLTRR